MKRERRAKSPAPKIEPMLTAADIAEALRIPREKVYDLMRDAGVPCYRIGRRVRYRAREFGSYLSAQKERA